MRLDDAFDSGFQPRSIDRVARLHVVVEDDAVIVVDQLSLVAELDRGFRARPFLIGLGLSGSCRLNLPRRTVGGSAPASRSRVCIEDATGSRASRCRANTLNAKPRTQRGHEGRSASRRVHSKTVEPAASRPSIFA